MDRNRVGTLIVVCYVLAGGNDLPSAPTRLASAFHARRDRFPAPSSVSGTGTPPRGCRLSGNGLQAVRRPGSLHQLRARRGGRTAGHGGGPGEAWRPGDLGLESGQLLRNAHHVLRPRAGTGGSWAGSPAAHGSQKWAADRADRRTKAVVRSQGSVLMAAPAASHGNHRLHQARTAARRPRRPSCRRAARLRARRRRPGAALG